MKVFPWLTVSQARLITTQQLVKMVDEAGFIIDTLDSLRNEAFEIYYKRTRSLTFIADCSFSEDDMLTWLIFPDVNVPFPKEVLDNYRGAITALTNVLGVGQVLTRNQGDISSFHLSLGCSRHSCSHPLFFSRMYMEVILLMMLLTRAFLGLEFHIPEDWRTWREEVL